MFEITRISTNHFFKFNFMQTFTQSLLLMFIIKFPKFLKWHLPDIKLQFFQIKFIKTTLTTSDDESY